MCVYDTEDHCDTCTDGYTVSGTRCVAVTTSGGLSRNALVGIIIGVVVALVVVLLFLTLLFFYCGKKRKRIHSYENVEARLCNTTHSSNNFKSEGEACSNLGGVNSTTEERTIKNPLVPPPYATDEEVAAPETTDVIQQQIDRMHSFNGDVLAFQEEGNNQNPAVPEAEQEGTGEVELQDADGDKSARRSGRRTARRIRNTHREGCLFEDVDTDAMYNADNEVTE
ncbi:hypothetical protein STCU_12028 [Strigomonas culicis]|uniref:Uncharacterized protein n=1 Tax=Strigomonas culicis TaxID=28005 RepID=S9TEQ0_9TRYP|nr:hypothetical protein STCU_12028 [Strigomonas culicis]|eukprot:EPY15434.1 hypothetical protein STCU_12028 [Strigomonas culicis]